MKRLIGALFIFLLSINTVNAAILLYDDCEDQWNTSNDWLAQGNGGLNSLTVSTEQHKAGNSSYKFVLAPYGSPSTQTNVELILRGINASPQIKNFLYGTTYWVGYSIYIPSDYVFPLAGSGDWMVNGQFHGAADACDNQYNNPMFTLENYSTDQVTGKYKGGIVYHAAACDLTDPQGGSEAYETGNLTLGAWNNVVMQFRFGYLTSQNPFLKVWINGNLDIDSTARNCYNDVKGPYFKLGLYGNMRYHDIVYTTVYYDEIRVGDANATYDDVVPGGTPTSVVVATTTLGPLVDTQTINGTLQAYGGTPPYTWTTSGTVPGWISVQSNGDYTITTPTAGPYLFNIIATDSLSAYDEQQLYGTVSSEGTIIKTIFGTTGNTAFSTTGTATFGD